MCYTVWRKVHFEHSLQADIWEAQRIKKIWIIQWPSTVLRIRPMVINNICDISQNKNIPVWRIRIQIRRIRIFLASRIRILSSSSKNSKKKLDFYCFETSVWLFIFEECVPDPHPDPDPLVRGTDPRIRMRIRTKMSRILNTGPLIPLYKNLKWFIHFLENDAFWV